MKRPDGGFRASTQEHKAKHKYSRKSKYKDKDINDEAQEYLKSIEYYKKHSPEDGGYIP